jgi:uncharacterized membrane protein YgcG
VLLAFLSAPATAAMAIQRDWVVPPPGGTLTVPPIEIGGAINDFTGNFTPEEQERLGQKLVDAYHRTGLKIALIHVSSTGVEPINDYAMRVFDAWSNGLLDRRSIVFVVALDDKRWWISTGYEVEGFLPDVAVSRISREVFEPTLRERGYYAGIDATLDALISAADKEAKSPTLHRVFPAHTWAVIFLLWWGLLLGGYLAWRRRRRPRTTAEVPAAQPSYAGFWARAQAGVIDVMLYLLVAAPVLALTYDDAYYFLGPLQYADTIQFVTIYLLPLIAVIGFWQFRSATPGKAVLAVRIVDAATGGRPSLPKLVIRGLGYLLSFLPLGLGVFWIAWDRRKQGWHDKLAGTVVIRY